MSKRHCELPILPCRQFEELVGFFMSATQRARHPRRIRSLHFAAN